MILGELIIKALKYFPRRIKAKLLGDIPYQIHDLNTKVDKTHLFLKLFTEMHGNADFQGQLDQDLLVYLYFKGRKNGFFLDIGANDGKTGSNTYALEQLGWTGACVEPLPDIFLELKQNRTCDCYNVAISDNSGEEVEFLRAPAHTLSGLASQMSEAHKNRILYGDGGGRIDSIKVKTLSFDDLMNQYPPMQCTHIDFMSIDTEGSELSILKTIDFTKYRFGLITVEDNKEFPGSGEQLKKFMEQNGYGVLIELGWDVVFVPNNRSNGDE
ncbi:hypothetical protein FACS1894163_13700 [Spirochaetia bacterium]|nr:hypothetical protein FACS1894163_13700 [Spirochaetia bacterium]